MYRLLEKSEISGTCWVEFNVTGSSETYEHWQDSSRYASLEAMGEVYQVFAICIRDFDLYRPTLLDSQKANMVSVMLDAFASKSSRKMARNFASELSFFLRDSAADKSFIWVLGV